MVLGSVVARGVESLIVFFVLDTVAEHSLSSVRVEAAEDALGLLGLRQGGDVHGRHCFGQQVALALSVRHWRQGQRCLGLQVRLRPNAEHGTGPIQSRRLPRQPLILNPCCFAHFPR